LRELAPVGRLGLLLGAQCPRTDAGARACTAGPLGAMAVPQARRARLIARCPIDGVDGNGSVAAGTPARLPRLAGAVQGRLRRAQPAASLDPAPAADGEGGAVGRALRPPRRAAALGRPGPADAHAGSAPARWLQRRGFLSVSAVSTAA